MNSNSQPGYAGSKRTMIRSSGNQVELAVLRFAGEIRATSTRPRVVVQAITFNSARGGTRSRKAKTGGQLIWLEVFVMWRQRPIWEPKDASSGRTASPP